MRKGYSVTTGGRNQKVNRLRNRSKHNPIYFETPREYHDVEEPDGNDIDFSISASRPWTDTEPFEDFLIPTINEDGGKNADRLEES